MAGGPFTVSVPFELLDTAIPIGCCEGSDAGYIPFEITNDDPGATDIDVVSSQTWCQVTTSNGMQVDGTETQTVNIVGLAASATEGILCVFAGTDALAVGSHSVTVTVSSDGETDHVITFSLEVFAAARARTAYFHTKNDNSMPANVIDELQSRGEYRCRKANTVFEAEITSTPGTAPEESLIHTRLTELGLTDDTSLPIASSDPVFYDYEWNAGAPGISKRVNLQNANQVTTEEWIEANGWMVDLGTHARSYSPHLVASNYNVSQRLPQEINDTGTYPLASSPGANDGIEVDHRPGNAGDIYWNQTGVVNGLDITYLWQLIVGQVDGGDEGGFSDNGAVAFDSLAITSPQNYITENDDGTRGTTSPYAIERARAQVNATDADYMTTSSLTPTGAMSVPWLQHRYVSGAVNAGKIIPRDHWFGTLQAWTDKCEGVLHWENNLNPWQREGILNNVYVANINNLATDEEKNQAKEETGMYLATSTMAGLSPANVLYRFRVIGETHWTQVVDFGVITEDATATVRVESWGHLADTVISAGSGPTGITVQQVGGGTPSGTAERHEDAVGFFEYEVVADVSALGNGTISGSATLVSDQGNLSLRVEGTVLGQGTAAQWRNPGPYSIVPPRAQT